MKFLCVVTMTAALAFAVGDAKTASVGPGTKQGVGAVSQQGRASANAVTAVNAQQAFAAQQARRRLLILLFIVITNAQQPSNTASPSQETTTTNGGTPEPTTTTAPTTPMVTLPAPFNSWHEFKGCRYVASSSAVIDRDATTACNNFGSGTVLAHKNVRTAADRAALFRAGLNLWSDVWLGLKDADGTDPTPAKWLNGDDYNDVITPQYSNGDFSSIAFAVGPNFGDITFLSENTPNTKFYVCEYCP